MNEPRSVYIPLEGRVAVVSGGGKGLGRSFCLALARQGARVVVNNHNRDADAAGRVVAEIAAAGGEAVADYGDVADPGSGQAMVAAALERWGRLDICVANAAIGTPGMFHKQPAEEFGRVIDVNLLGSARLARAAMAVMRPAGFGRIILVASAGGLHGDVGLSAYAASKGGMLALGRTLAVEGAPRGVLTNTSSPAEAGCGGHRWWSGTRSSYRTGRIFTRVSCTPCWPRAAQGSRMSTASRWTRSTT